MAVSKKSTHTAGQVLAEYVVVLGVLAVVLAAVSPLLHKAVTAARLRFTVGAVGLP
ncbi:MAG TPA: hypothetical protein GXX28_05665 [Firmicutes bacterium]|nr:hypothetical protein [Bacillota bacterium]